jgi:MinD superfamily P-loop ATPase
MEKTFGQKIDEQMRKSEELRNLVKAIQNHANAEIYLSRNPQTTDIMDTIDSATSKMKDSIDQMSESIIIQSEATPQAINQLELILNQLNEIPIPKATMN